MVSLRRRRHAGRRYATVIVEPSCKRVLWVKRGRSREEIRSFFELGRQVTGRSMGWFPIVAVGQVRVRLQRRRRTPKGAECVARSVVIHPAARE